MGTAALSVGVTLASLAAVVAALVPFDDPRLQIVVATAGAALALHGLGRAVCAGRPDVPATTATALGLAAYLMLGGWLAALGVFDRRGQGVVLLGGLVIGAAWAWRARPAATRRQLAWAGALVGLVALAALAAAGVRDATYTDGGAFLLGPRARLDQLGDLGDAVGLPRAHGLGGSVVALTLGWALPSVRDGHAIDGGLGLGLAIALAVRLGDGADARYRNFAIVAVILGVPALGPDLAPTWLTVALLLALAEAYRDVDRRGLVVLAAGLVGMVHVGVGVLAAVAVVAIRGHAGARAWLTTAALVLAAPGGYLLAWAVAPHGGDGLVAATRAAIGLAAGLGVWAILGLLLRPLDHPPTGRWLVAIGAGVATSIAAGPTLSAAAVALIPVAIAVVLVVLGRGLTVRGAPRPGAIVASLATVLILAGLRFPLGRPPQPWGARLQAALVDADAAGRRDDPRGESARYRAAQARIPAGARVGAWVEYPELLDFRRHDIVLLRTPRAAACAAATPTTQACRDATPLPDGLAFVLLAAPAWPHDGGRGDAAAVEDVDGIVVVSLAP